ncbi:plasmid stabilization system [Arcobacter nitrofigilis DSM 7299]|uniref:Plasmid stabilization system n=1 Tax=Arcobacter nitrofigilis (strain ATCC 33309 / DSM 7299 / CCUG 15893 / LMG 7604 / NCTC 12251 / CI) TaxID=572480 RepID=D5V2X8_ARCNC|nr:type II toxin-antitoxin system RelE/ParE family toxin [Arcobacter nitrofigilis]ADG92560.1 plasmid stabilization system [Arcobacter nitrofigilis DSM 7299]
MKNYEVQWTEIAQNDLLNIIEYIKTDSVNTAKKIFFEIKEECNKLHYFPERNRVVPELSEIGISKYREVIHKRWRIIYKIENQIVYILLVVDSRQNLEDILFQRLIG